MKRTVVIALVVLVAAAAAWSAYAYAQGSGPLKRMGTAFCRPACEPSSQPCDNVPACHDGSACTCDAADCPMFKDEDGDGTCDIAGDCDRHGQSDHHKGTHHGAGRVVRGHGCGRHGEQ